MLHFKPQCPAPLKAAPMFGLSIPCECAAPLLAQLAWPIAIVRTWGWDVQEACLRSVAFKRKIKESGDEMLIDRVDPFGAPHRFAEIFNRGEEIGRASCRERV